ncbi:DUF3040 domain-containing protein [Actinophytocola sp.]|uniref:DUF3040 domain-containing protein n=1 Tax=Actinophytocola sp. TaxID=1872138 RepID=UPI002ED3ABFB
MSAMNRQENRALRAIEKSIKADDPELAELLDSFAEDDSENRTHRYVGIAAVPLLLLGISAGDVVLLMTGVLLAIWAVLGWTVRALR